MNVTIFGSTGGTGRAVTQALLAAGHRVKAFCRDPTTLGKHPDLIPHTGDAMKAADVEQAITGADAVIVSLGNSQNPFALLLGAKRTTPANICETGTRNIIGGMEVSGTKRLIVVTAFGVGATKVLPSAMTKLFFRLFLKEHMADKEKQEALVKASKLDWTLVQPFALISGPAKGQWFASEEGKLRKPEVTRADVASFLVSELITPNHILRTVTLSG